MWRLRQYRNRLYTHVLGELQRLQSKQISLQVIGLRVLLTSICIYAYIFRLHSYMTKLIIKVSTGFQQSSMSSLWTLQFSKADLAKSRFCFATSYILEPD
jgi:hypothetical protein